MPRWEDREAVRAAEEARAAELGFGGREAYLMWLDVVGALHLAAEQEEEADGVDPQGE